MACRWPTKLGVARKQSEILISPLPATNVLALQNHVMACSYWPATCHRNNLNMQNKSGLELSLNLQFTIRNVSGLENERVWWANAFQRRELPSRPPSQGQPAHVRNSISDARRPCESLQEVP